MAFAFGKALYLFDCKSDCSDHRYGDLGLQTLFSISGKDISIKPYEAECAFILIHFSLV